MIIAGKEYRRGDYFGYDSSVPDCNVTGSNKIGSGNGEAKFYISGKEKMREFYGGEGFVARCIMLKKDLLGYMDAIKQEYMHPSFKYGEEYFKKQDKKRKKPKEHPPLSTLWAERYNMINRLDDVISFNIQDQTQIEGDRGYVNSVDPGYKLFRKIALAESSYISACSLISDSGSKVYYWKLYVDYSKLEDAEHVPLALKYGSSIKSDTDESESVDNHEDEKQKAIRESRKGQGKYRAELLEQMTACPITGISDERLLIASHIKPWRSSEDNEKVDPYNGYMLSPMFDRLFDQGYITFTEDKKVHLSRIISDWNYRLIGIKENQCFPRLPMDEKRKEYLAFHRSNVFKDFGRFV